jgi:hypothetical protein
MYQTNGYTDICEAANDMRLLHLASISDFLRTITNALLALVGLRQSAASVVPR